MFFEETIAQLYISMNDERKRYRMCTAHCWMAQHHRIIGMTEIPLYHTGNDIYLTPLIEIWFHNLNVIH